MPISFYAALATSASVFIGILTAILASYLSNLSSRRKAIEQEIQSLISRKESLEEQQDELKSELEEINGFWEEQVVLPVTLGFLMEAIENLQEESIGKLNAAVKNSQDDPATSVLEVASSLEPDLIGAETALRIRDEISLFNNSPFRYILSESENLQEGESINIDKLVSEYADFNDIPSERVEKGEKERLNTYYKWLKEGSERTISPKEQITVDKREGDVEIYSVQHHTQTQSRMSGNKAEVEYLQRELWRLKEQYDTLDPSSIRSTLRVSVGTIAASVVIPLLALFGHTLDLSVGREPFGIDEVILVSGIWLIGLVSVLYHLHKKLNEEEYSNLNEAIDSDISDHL